jgi:hypothetical protein
MSPRVGPDAVEKRKILQCWESKPGCPARNPSLYRLAILAHKEKRENVKLKESKRDSKKRSRTREWKN